MYASEEWPENSFHLPTPPMRYDPSQHHPTIPTCSPNETHYYSQTLYIPSRSDPGQYSNFSAESEPSEDDIDTTETPADMGEDDDGEEEEGKQNVLGGKIKCVSQHFHQLSGNKSLMK